MPGDAREGVVNRGLLDGYLEHLDEGVSESLALTPAQTGDACGLEQVHQAGASERLKAVLVARLRSTRFCPETRQLAPHRSEKIGVHDRRVCLRGG
jgi:hypothetical protein